MKRKALLLLALTTVMLPLTNVQVSAEPVLGKSYEFL